MKSQTLPQPVNGTEIAYSPVNQAYLITWHARLLRVISNRDEAIAEFNRITE